MPCNNRAFFVILVHLAGIEPVRVASLDPKSSASASSAIGADALEEIEKEGTVSLHYFLAGAVYRNRTNNLMITNQLLCQLS